MRLNSCLTMTCKYIYYIQYTATLKTHYISRMVIIYIYQITAVSPKRLVLEQKEHYFCPPLSNPSDLIFYKMKLLNKVKSKFFWKLTDYNMQMSFLACNNFFAQSQFMSIVKCYTIFSTMSIAYSNSLSQIQFVRLMPIFILKGQMIRYCI